MANETKSGAELAGGCFSVLVAGAVCIWLLRSCSAIENKQQEEGHQAAIALEADDRAKAKDLGISYEEYRAARWASSEAYANCKTAAEGRAKHDYKSDWLPSSRWTLKGRTLSIVGHDLQMQNGFGVYGRVTYFCDWDMDGKAVKSLVVTED